MTENRRLALGSGIAGALILAALFALFKCPSPVSAQGPIGNVNFAQPFSVTLASTISYLSIKNIGQAAGSVQFRGVTGQSCPIYLEGSADNTNWSILAASPPGNAGSTFFYANGFFSYYRLAFNPNNNGSCNDLTVTGSYYGYAAPLPINSVDEWVTASSVSTPTLLNLTGFGPVGLDGIQCTNTGAATAYLQLFASNTAPTLGSNFFFQVGIGAGLTFATGKLPSYATTLSLYAGASTAAGGSTAGGPLVCNFQINPTGPFYPLLPVGP
jgi:hypothetical protein